MRANPNLKKSVFLVGLEKFSMILFQFISSIILARLLTPEDYGIVAMIAIFISLSGILVDSGFGGALVYYKDVDKKDYSTVFWMNMALSISLYTLIYINAETISEFYQTPILSDLIKVLGLSVVFNSIGLIQFTILYKNLEFKTLGFISVISYILSALIAIALAYWGFGVWALIAQQVLASILKTILYVICNRFVPDLYFSWRLLKKHWSFGSGLFFSTLLRTIYDNMYLQLIGKYCSVTNAGYYNQAQKLKDIPSNLFSNTFDTSLFPIFSKIEDENLFVEKYRMINRMFSFCCIPIFFIMAVLSKDIVLWLLGEKWIGSAWILSIMSIGAIFYIFESISRSIFKAKGKSGLIFRLDIVKRSSAILLMFIAIVQYELTGIVYVFVINSIIGYLINQYYLSRIIPYPIIRALKDMGWYFIVSAGIAVIIFYITSLKLIDGHLSNCIIFTVVFIVLYIIIAILMKDYSIQYIKSIIQKKK